MACLTKICTGMNLKKKEIHANLWYKSSSIFAGRGRAQNAPAPGAGAPPPQQLQSSVGRGKARGGQPSASQQQAPRQQAPPQQKQQQVDNATEQMARMAVKEEKPHQRRGIGE